MTQAKLFLTGLPHVPKEYYICGVCYTSRLPQVPSTKAEKATMNSPPKIHLFGKLYALRPIRLSNGLSCISTPFCMEKAQCYPFIVLIVMALCVPFGRKPNGAKYMQEVNKQCQEN